MIPRNAPAFGHKDLTVTITPLEGVNARRIFTLRSASSVKIDPGPKAARGKGLSVGPVFVVATAADPTGEIKLDNANESADLLKHLGHTGVLFSVSAVFTRRGAPSRHYQCTPCAVDGGFGFDSSADAPPSDTVKFAPVDILVDKVSVYPPKGE